jgi:hypothetical protein
MPTPFPCGVAGFRWRIIGSGVQVLVRLADWKVVATLRRVEGSKLWRCNDGKAVLVAVARVQAEQAAKEAGDGSS